MTGKSRSRIRGSQDNEMDLGTVRGMMGRLGGCGGEGPLYPVWLCNGRADEFRKPVIEAPSL
jgi:hypothetical protein